MKDATVSARVEYDVKTEAEDILQRLGIPVSVVINTLYRQIIYRHGVPFSLTIPQELRTIDAMSDAELNAKLHKLCKALHKRCYAKLVVMQSQLRIPFKIKCAGVFYFA